jgi:hypothetical protein
VGYYMAGGDIGGGTVPSHTQRGGLHALGGDVAEAESPGPRGTHRRMNALNPHALRRSMRRVQAFAKFAKRTIQFTHRVKMKRHRRK